MQDLIECKLLKKKPRTCWCVFDFPIKEAQLSELQKKSEEPDLWNDPEQARDVMKKLARLRDEVEDWRAVQQRVNDALELAQLDDESLRADLEKEIQSL